MISLFVNVDLTTEEKNRVDSSQKVAVLLFDLIENLVLSPKSTKWDCIHCIYNFF